MLKEKEKDHTDLPKEAEISIHVDPQEKEKCIMAHLQSLWCTVMFSFLELQLNCVLFLLVLVLLCICTLPSNGHWLKHDPKQRKNSPRREQSLMQMPWKLSWKRVYLIFYSKVFSTFKTTSVVIYYFQEVMDCFSKSD